MYLAAFKAGLLACLWIGSNASALELPDVTSFSPLKSENGVSVSMLKVEGSNPWILGVTDLDSTAEKIYDLLNNYRNYSKIFKGSVGKSKVIETSQEGTRLHVVWPVPFPMSDRDAVVSYRSEKIGSGYVIDWHNDARPGDPEEGLRIAIVRGRTTIEAQKNGKTRITYLYFGDLGGDLPDFVKNSAWEKEPGVYFDSIKAALNQSTSKL